MQGLAGWLVALPLVIITYLISANLFQSSGSSNPAIGMMMEVAQKSEAIPAIVFYFTISVLAPFVEESLFRGFFYAFYVAVMVLLFLIVISPHFFGL